MRILSVLQSNYIPWKGYFDLIRSADEFVILDEVQYTKNDWRNRNQIKTANGLQWLTIPIKSHFIEHPRICDVEVSEPRWATKHWRSVEQAYARSPYLPRYRDEIETLYNDCRNITSLSRINRHFLDAFCRMLEIKTPIRRASDVLEGLGVETMDRNLRLINLCKSLGADAYLSGPAANDYIDEDLFRQNGIKLIWADYSNYPVYPQLHGEFKHGVSVLDMILNLGSKSTEYMTDVAARGR